MKPWLVIAGGGTAGHLVPGLVVADELVTRGHPRESIHFVGSSRGIERTMVPAAGYEVTLLPGRGIERRLSLQNVVAVVGLVAAVVQSLWLVARNRPRVVLTLGGYASVPAAMSAVLWRVPLIVAEQNARAGLANRLVARFAVASAVPFAETDLPRSVLTGNPVRPELVAARDMDQTAAKSVLGMPEERLMLAVFSGSLGSRKINESLLDLVDRWADRSDLAVHHVIGRRDWDTVRNPEALDLIDSTDTLRRWERRDGLYYQRVPYESRMAEVLAAADVALCRSGGSTVAELAVLGVPAVLVPLPIAPRNHQEFNAGDLVRAGGGVLIVDRDLDVDSLEVALFPMLSPGPERDSMAAAAASVAIPDAAARVADLIEDRATARGSRGRSTVRDGG